ncbi:hypothetical protein D3C80_1522770 [compost metagenome]
MLAKACRLQCIPQFTLGRGRFCQPQIISDAVSEKLTSLRHERARQSADPARRRLHFTSQKLDEAGLARTARADNRNRLSGGDCKVDIRQDRIFVPIPLQPHTIKLSHQAHGRHAWTVGGCFSGKTRRNASCRKKRAPEFHCTTAQRREGLQRGETDKQAEGGSRRGHNVLLRKPGHAEESRTQKNRR